MVRPVLEYPQNSPSNPKEDTMDHQLQIVEPAQVEEQEQGIQEDNVVSVAQTL